MYYSNGIENLKFFVHTLINTFPKLLLLRIGLNSSNRKLLLLQLMIKFYIHMIHMA